MLKPIGVQLYSLRDLTVSGYASVLKAVADIGYQCVEPAGFRNTRPSEFKKMADDLGLKIISSHTPWARQAGTLGEIMEIADILQLDKIVCGYGPDQFKDLDAIKATADNTNAMRETLAKNGFTLFQHNHDFEFGRIDGKIKYEIYKELCPGLKFEMDCFWSTNRGRENAVEMLKLFADSTILLHLKDGFHPQQIVKNAEGKEVVERGVDLRPLGTGDLPIKDLIEATPDSVEAIIVELDFCNINMMTAIEMSYKYLVENKLAAGNK